MYKCTYLSGRTTKQRGKESDSYQNEKEQEDTSICADIIHACGSNTFDDQATAHLKNASPEGSIDIHHACGRSHDG